MSDKPTRPKASELLRRTPPAAEPTATEVQDYERTEVQVDEVRPTRAASHRAPAGMARVTFDLPAAEVHDLKLRALSLGVTSAAIVEALVKDYLSGAIDIDPQPIHRARRRGGQRPA